MKAIKLIWMADRLHLREYGRPITNDEYIAMKFGPVGSVSRNITDEAIPYLTDEQFGYSQKYVQKTSNNFFKSVNDIDTAVFSESELEALDKIYTDFGAFDQFQLFALTHEFPEWKKFQKQIEAKLINQAQMSYMDFFENPEETSELLSGKFKAAKAVFNQSTEKINIARQAFAERTEIEGLWS